MRKYLFAILSAFLLPAFGNNAVAQTTLPGASEESERHENFTVRTNLLYDALIVPTLGFEWRMSDSWGLKLDGSWSYWCSRFGKVQDVWIVSPELRHYIGQTKSFYLGFGVNAGGYNIYNLGPVASTFPDGMGYVGKIYNGGLVIGYQKRLFSSFSLDFNVGMGYNRLEYDSYTMIRCDSCAYKSYVDKNVTKNWFGPTQAGISLVWHFGKPKGRTVSAPS